MKGLELIYTILFSACMVIMWFTPPPVSYFVMAIGLFFWLRSDIVRIEGKLKDLEDKLNFAVKNILDKGE